MQVSIRPYHEAKDDLARMAELIQQAWLPERHLRANFHVGDLYWRLREPAYARTLWLWEQTSGQICAFAEWDPSAGTLEFQYAPSEADKEWEQASLDWAESQTAIAESRAPTLTTYATEGDAVYTALLLSRGYVREDAYYNHHYRSLDSETVEMPVVPEGYAVRYLQGEQEIESRVEGHRGGWQTQRMQVEHYRRIMQMPGYRPELDIVVVAPDGTFAATCICWLDAVSRAGLFEPVSTHPEHRRRGLARAMVLYGLRQLQQLGARSAWVGSASANPTATRLYESCGMRVVRKDYTYKRNSSG